jgi:carbonic anhydrase
MSDRTPTGKSLPLEAALSFTPELWNSPEPSRPLRALLLTCPEVAPHSPPIQRARVSRGVVIRRPGAQVAPFWLAGPAEVAEIDTALRECDITDLVICGHVSCRGLAGEPEGASHDAAARRGAPGPIGRILGAVAAGNRRAARARDNVLLQLRNIVTYPMVAQGLACGRLRLHGWLYQEASNVLAVYDPVRQVFVPLSPDRQAGTALASDLCPSM